jgi:acylphosphatase
MGPTFWHAVSLSGQRDEVATCPATPPLLQFALREVPALPRSAHMTAKRYFISGQVQGVGYRFFAVRLAQRLGIAGFVRNLRDGRVEVYAIGDAGQHEDLRAALERGPNASCVSSVIEEDAAIVPRHSDGFAIEEE